MRHSPFVLFFALGASAQAPLDPPRPSADRVVAEVSGQKVTIGDLRKIIANAPPNVFEALQKDPRDFFERYTLLTRLTADAKKAGLENVSPYKDRLMFQRSTVLMMSYLEDQTRNAEIPPAEIEAYYKANQQRFRVAQFTPIAIPFEKVPGPGKLTEAQAKARAEQVVKLIRDGASFELIAAEYSDKRTAEKFVGDNAEITPASKLPEALKQAVFSTLPGQVTEPQAFADAYFVFLIRKLDIAPLAEVSDLIAEEKRTEMAQRRLEELRQSIKAEVKHKVYFEMQNPAAPPREIPADLTPQTVVAVVNGRSYTADEMGQVLNGAAPNVRQAASQQPEAFLVQFELLRSLAEEARKAKLDQKPPASDRIAWTDRQVLMQAQIDETMKGIKNSPEEQEAAYKAQQERFRTAQVKLIYISYQVAPPPSVQATGRVRTEPEAKKLAEEIVAKAKAGTEFVLLVQQYSEEPNSKAKNGDFIPIDASNPQIPDEVKKAVLSTPKGEIAPPVRLPNGYYLFRVENVSVTPYDQVRNQIYEELRQEKFKKWFDSVRESIQIKVEDEAAIRAELLHTR
jgi:parvulin-like peptidyl-prolyl isomerase